MLGPAPAGSRDTLRMNGVGKRESKGEIKRLIFLGLHRKPIKPLTWDFLCSRRPQAPSRWSENTERFLNWVLEAWAGKWTQRASALQGISLKKERERDRMKRRDQALMKPGLQLYFQRELLYPELHIYRSERCRGRQSQFNIMSVWSSSRPGCFLNNFPFDWLCSLQPKTEKLYTANKNKTRSWLWLRSWAPYYQIQT